MDCNVVERYLERFANDRKGLDHDAISEHVMLCSTCYERMAEFFRVMEVPKTEYLEETLDDLTGAIYNLAKALVKEPPAEEESTHDNIRFLSEPEDAEHYLREGSEMIDDVQDFTGVDDVRGESMESLRALMRDTQRQFDLVMSLLQTAIDLEGRFSPDCCNLKGILHLSNDQLDEAERCFRSIIRKPFADIYMRTVQVHAMNNLSYVCSGQDRIAEAIKWATRSKALAEECGLGTFSARFGLMYFHLQRNEGDDLERAAAEVEEIVSTPATRQEFLRCLELEENEAVRRLYNDSGLAARFV